MKLREIKRSISALPPKELDKLDAWLHALIKDRESQKRVRGPVKQHEVLQAHRTARKTYRHELVRCGRESCKCVEGKLHGPYWYAYWSEGGKTRSYIGKRLPKGVKPRRDESSATSDNSYVIHLPNMGLHKKVIRPAGLLTHLYHPYPHRETLHRRAVNQQLNVLVEHPFPHS
jgi:hypothetical protein